MRWQKVRLPVAFQFISLQTWDVEGAQEMESEISLVAVKETINYFYFIVV